MHIEVRSPRGERESEEDRVTEGRRGEHGERAERESEERGKRGFMKVRAKILLFILAAYLKRKSNYFCIAARCSKPPPDK